MADLRLAQLHRQASEIGARRARDGFTLDGVLANGPQRAFARAMLSRSRTATHAGRRAGKTTAEAFVALWDTGEPPFVPQFYMTLTRVNAGKIFWPELLRLNDVYKLGCEINMGDLWIRRKGGAPLYLLGADNERELEKVRGNKFKRGIIDEAGHFRIGFVESLIKERLQAALVDYGGKLTVSGTPGMTRTGFFYEICKGKLSHKWDVHHWTLAQNDRFPALVAGRTAEEIFREVREEFEWTEDDPTFRREYHGEFVEDANAMLFAYDDSVNGVDSIDLTGDWQTVMGVDLGADDATAIAVCGWRKHDRRLHVLHEVESPGDGKLDIDGVVEMIRPLVARWDPQAIVIDQGGLGKLIANSIRNQYQIPVQPAEKARKSEHIKMLNTDLRRGRVIVQRDGLFARDARLVERDPRGLQREVLQEKPGGYHSNITDSVLYAWREARHWLETPEPDDPNEEEQIWQARLNPPQVDPWSEVASRLGYD